MRDTSKVIALAGASTAFAKAQIQVYSAAGEGILLFSVVISLRIPISSADCCSSGTKARSFALDGLVMND